MNSRALLSQLKSRIRLSESAGELESIASMVIEFVFKVSRSDILLGVSLPADPDHERLMDAMVDRVNRHEPIQYITGIAAFYGRDFHVTPSVLIPRPETEELVREVVAVISKDQDEVKIADIGTGSGCIAITLALALPRASILATDIDRASLQVAEGNARRHHANVNFIQHDILAMDLPHGFDAIISNPPYIAASERTFMQANVVDYEPHRALFVDDENPLIFYNAIAKRARQALNPFGLLAVEINERFGEDVVALLRSEGFESVTLTKDAFGKERIVKGFVS